VAEDPGITKELSEIYTNIQKILDLRHKYMRLSLQGKTDNPKDDASWNIYPPPPAPVWVPEGSQVLPPLPPKAPTIPHDGSEMNRGLGTKGRKAGHDIGSDFDFEECEVPSGDEMEFRLDETGVFQVYETKKGLQSL